MAKNVLMIVNTFVRDDARVMAEAISLARQGYSVQVIGAARYGKQPVRELMKGVSIVSLPMVVSWRPLILVREVWRWLKGNPGETTDGEGFRTNSKLATLFFTLWALRLGFHMAANIVHCHDVAQLPVGWIIAKIKRIPLIYDAHEDARAYYGRIGALIEKWLISKPDAVITVGERLKKALLERGARQVVVIGNWKSLEKYAVSPEKISALRQKLGLGNGLVVCYLGTLDHFHYLSELLVAVEQSNHVILLISGRGPLSAEVVAAAQRCGNIRWLGWLNLDDLPLYTLLADVLFYCANPTLYLQATYLAPNKLFEAFAAGIPLIAQRGVGEMGEILEHIPAAMMLDIVTPKTLRAAFTELRDPETLQKLKAHTQEGRTQYNWGIAEQRLYTLYEDLLKRSTTK